MADDLLKKIISHSKEYGFIFQSSEIYDGLSAVYDYGQNGAELKNNIKEYWWKSMVQLHDNIVGLDAAIFMHPKTWEASGHVGAFNDPLIDNKDSKKRYRADVLIEEFRAKYEVKIAKEVKKAKKKFGANTIYLRPETAQGIFVNFLNVMKSGRMKVPFGIAQIGKAFRNEIVARQFIFRMREFEQMEMQFFVRPGDEKKWFEYWKNFRVKWHNNLNLGEENIKLHEHDKFQWVSKNLKEFTHEQILIYQDIKNFRVKNCSILIPN